MALQAEHDLAAHSGFDGNKDLPAAVFRFNDVIQLREFFFYHVAHVPSLKIQDGIGVSPVFETKLLIL